MKVEVGMLNAEMEVVKCLTFLFSAFRIPHSNFRIPRCLTSPSL